MFTKLIIITVKFGCLKSEAGRFEAWDPDAAEPTQDIIATLLINCDCWK